MKTITQTISLSDIAFAVDARIYNEIRTAPDGTLTPRQEYELRPTDRPALDRMSREATQVLADLQSHFSEFIRIPALENPDLYSTLTRPKVTITLTLPDSYRDEAALSIPSTIESIITHRVTAAILLSSPLSAKAEAELQQAAPLLLILRKTLLARRRPVRPPRF